MYKQKIDTNNNLEACVVLVMLILFVILLKLSQKIFIRLKNYTVIFRLYPIYMFFLLFL
uniref:Hypothetical secreted peptide n=1 Tax=Simulium nigrimanum TaxID=683695 RepID=D1FQ39_SIMNI